jgi:hypothetical protein
MTVFTAVGQWRQDLVVLERKLQHELDEGPESLLLGTATSAPDARIE